MKNKVTITIILSSALISIAIAQPTIPKLINYQGKLTDGAGNPINGTRSVQFSLYTVATGGTAFWTETQTVSISNGLFNVMLGSVNPITSMPSAGVCYLGVKVGTDPELTPRKRIGSVAYSYYAEECDKLDGQHASAFAPASGSPNYIQVSGNVTQTNMAILTGGGQTTLHSHPGGGGGTVTQVSQGTGIVCSPNPITTTGSVAVNFAGTGSASTVSRSDHNHWGASWSGSGPGITFSSSDGIGVKGVSTSYRGVQGESQNGEGVRGYSANYYGIVGIVGNSTNPAVIGQNTISNCLGAFAYGNYGVYGRQGSGTHAGYFFGNVQVTGSLTKGSGSFLIDHPLDPLNKTLRHNFIESPENLCLYRGKIKLDAKGEAKVAMPSYFTALTKENEATIILTSVGKPFSTGYEWNNDYTQFTVFGEPEREVSYIVLADRDDPVIRQLYRPVEEMKGNGNFETGKLLYPEAYGYPKEMGIGYQSESDIIEKSTMNK
ncbi:MAG: hypothetical protein ABIK31_07795 [candidate division WOR-3 bacterium]